MVNFGSNLKNLIENFGIEVNVENKSYENIYDPEKLKPKEKIALRKGLLEKDIDFSIFKKEVKGFTYKNTKVLLYIPKAYYTNMKGTHPSKLHRYHLTHCSTLEQQQQSGSLKNYAISNRDDGKFKYEFSDGIEENQELNVCQNCLEKIYGDKKYPFNLKEFLAVKIEIGKEQQSRTVKIGNLEFQDDNLPDLMNWDDACAYCKKLKMNGFSDWRLPEIEELKIAYKHRSEFKNIEYNFYWSNTKDNGNTSYSWILYFSNGGVGSNGYQSNSHYVRCLR
jgi:hypothetical protein